MILVIGATGQLGFDVVRNLAEAGRPVRALVRPGSAHADIDAIEGVEVATGDLADHGSIDRAVEGVETVVATAGTVAPRNGDRRADILDRGYGHLIEAAEKAGVEQFVFVSVPLSPETDVAPEFRFKRLIEERLVASSMAHTILRFPMFTEVWLAIAGSSIPERGEPRSPLKRDYPFLQRFRKMTGRMVEDRGRLMVNGPATNRQAFISVHDVGRIVAASVGHPAAMNQVAEIGGPEVLDWNDVAALWSRLLGREVKVMTTPGAVFRVNQVLLGPFAPNAANIMGMNAASAAMDTPWEPGQLVKELGIDSLKTVREVLEDKLALPA